MTATLTPIERLAALRRLSALKPYQWACGEPDCDGRPHHLMPHPHARAGQLPPSGAWWAWFLMSGRGFGKTRSGAEYVKDRAMSQPKHRVAVIAPSFGVGRDVCIEGESGLLAILPPSMVPKKSGWNRSIGELTLINGSVFKIFGTDNQKDAEKVRGFQFHTAWFEEIGTQVYGQVAWDMLAFALRLGMDPRVAITGTPRPTPLIRKLVKDHGVIVTKGTTYDNAANLAPAMLDRIKDKYEGTTLGRQELSGELLDGAKGALWAFDLIKHWIDDVPPMTRIVVAVDPAGTAHSTSDLTGIVVMGLDATRGIWVLADKSGRYSPEGWRQVICDAVEDWQADLVVAEVNFGADMVASNLRSAASPPPFKPVHASRGKEVRATPVLALYEQQRVRHAGVHADLEQEMCTWIPPGRFDEEGQPIEPSKDSPNRLDALVWGAHELAGLNRPRKGRVTSHFEA